MNEIDIIIDQVKKVVTFLQYRLLTSNSVNFNNYQDNFILNYSFLVLDKQ